VSSRHLIDHIEVLRTKGKLPYRQKAVMMIFVGSYGNKCRATYRTWDSEMRYKLCYIQVLFELQKYRETDDCRTNTMRRSVTVMPIIFSGSEA